MTKQVKNDAQVEQKTCRFCRGSGKDPFGVMSWLSTCCVCGGKGSIFMRLPNKACAHCSGTGAIKTLTCTSCSGKGFVLLNKGSNRSCPDCNGSGDDKANPYLACLQCRGHGFING